MKTGRILSLAIGAIVMQSAVATRADDLSGQHLNSADRSLSRSSSDAMDARRELDYAIANQRDASIRARNAISSLETLRTVLDDPSAVDKAAADARAAASDLEAKSRVVSEAQARLDVAAGAVEQYRAQARTTFESSPAFAQAGQALDQAQSRVDVATAWSYLQLENDPQYAGLVAAAEFAQARVEQLRDNPQTDPGVLSRASQSWINALNQVNNYTQYWLGEDVNVSAAQDVLTVAEVDRNRLNARFDGDLSNDPQLSALIAARDVHQRDVQSLNEELRVAAEASRAAQERSRQIQATYAQANAQFIAVQQELVASRIQIEQTSTAIDQADRRLRWALDEQDRAAIDRDRAARDWRLSQEEAERNRLERERIIRDRDDRDQSDRNRAADNRDRDRQQREADFERDRNQATQLPTRDAAVAPPPPPQAPRNPPPQDDYELRRQQDEQRRQQAQAETDRRQRDEDQRQQQARADQQRARDEQQRQEQQQRAAQAEADRRQRDEAVRSRSSDDSSRSPIQSRDTSSFDRGSRYQR